MANNRSDNNNGGRGFAGMDDDKQRKIAQKGGEAVSRDRQHMSDIGRKGGEASGGGNRGGNQGGGNQGGNRGGGNR
jgi:general stress protein YciG